jgi:hypothetical protein
MDDLTDPRVDNPQSAAQVWARVLLGIHLKTFALWLLVISPLLTLLYPPLLWGLVSLVLALLIDFAGRCYTATAPTPRRWPIQTSILLQALAGLALVSLLSLDQMLLALVAVLLLQSGAAWCFTLFLEDIARELGRSDLVMHARDLRSRVRATVYSFLGSTVLSVFLFALALAIGIATYVGWLVTVPAAILGSLLILLMSGMIFLWMLGNYERTLSGVRGALQAVVRGQADSLAEPPVLIPKTTSGSPRPKA